MKTTLVVNQKTANKIRGLPACPDSVIFNPGVPILIADLDMGFQRWVPPKSGKFVELGPEDEHWARPLGIGTLEDVDFFAFKVPDGYTEKYNTYLDNQIVGRLGIPKGVFEGTTTSSSYAGSIVAMESLMKRLGFGCY